ncbi:MAG: inorganic phosphate transporter [Spirochaetota bacterium]
MEFIYIALVLLVLLAIFDLVAGVSNDAVNFLNSAIGSKVANVKTILLIASIGILVGVTLSSGMMEIARKGIFNPENFYLLEVMIIFVAVMLADILLLDLFNTFGLPTSTTVSMVFELLGASVVISLIKLYQAGSSFIKLGEYINTAKVLGIISGILLSVVIAFTAGLIIQFISRIIFTFNYAHRLKRYGALWGAFALVMISYFILLKGTKGASFITDNQSLWIQNNIITILAIVFCTSFIILLMMQLVAKVNILKFIVLAGTFALALSFASNDLVNFIGVPLAGFSSFFYACSYENPLAVLMESLRNPVKANTFVLLLAGLIMALTLWISRKARTVTKTEVNLGRQDDGLERFEPSFLARILVRMGVTFMDTIQKVIPKKLLDIIRQRKDISHFTGYTEEGKIVSFDLIRASVNLVVASALISLGTTFKLPLSTTYVTFMVAMGTSLADGAWDRESAVYRVSGVITVIGGWFMTAFIAFTIAGVYAFILYHSHIFGLLAITTLSGYLLYKNHIKHKELMQSQELIEVYNLKKIKDPVFAIKTSFEQTGKLLEETSKSIQRSFNGLKLYDRIELRIARNDSKKIQDWTNIIVANIFKTLRLLYKMNIPVSQRYGQLISNLQEIAESQRDIALRSYLHVENHHKGFLNVHITELEQLIKSLKDLLDLTVKSLKQDKIADLAQVEKRCNHIAKLIFEFDRRQIIRIQNETSKTRLSILFYAYLVNIQKISTSTKNLLGIFNESLHLNGDLSQLQKEESS